MLDVLLTPIGCGEESPSATQQPFTLDDHSKVAPRLPIPNRIVKRLRADDSGLRVCESRSSSGTYPAQNPICKRRRWGFAFGETENAPARDTGQHALAERFSSVSNLCI